MDVHNTVEDTVIAKVKQLFEEIGNNKANRNICLCEQCQVDVTCYALNRLPPRYIVSNRGVSRVKNESIEYQQQAADIVSLVNEGLKIVSHNQRPNFSHSSEIKSAGLDSKQPVYNVPAIMGRVFNGVNFAPVSDVKLELIWDNKLISMKDGNWQNPCVIVPKNEGNYSFWPAADIASGVGKHKLFEYTLKVSAAGFETLVHFFKIPVASEISIAGSFSLERTFKLPDLYIFPPGDNENDRCLD